MENSQKSVSFKHFGFRMVTVILFALTLCGVATAQNPVIDWNAIAVTTALNGNQTISPASNSSGGASLYLAYTHLAIYDAVNAIDHRFSALRTGNRSAGGSIGRCRGYFGGLPHTPFLFSG